MKNNLKLGIILLAFTACTNQSKELEIKPSSNEGEDTVISSGLPFQNFNDDENIHLYVGKQADSVSKNRVLINFKNIPANVKIDSSFLYLKFNF